MREPKLMPLAGEPETQFNCLKSSANLRALVGAQNLGQNLARGQTFIELDYYLNFWRTGTSAPMTQPARRKLWAQCARPAQRYSNESAAGRSLVAPGGARRPPPVTGPRPPGPARALTGQVIGLAKIFKALRPDERRAGPSGPWRASGATPPVPAGARLIDVARARTSTMERRCSRRRRLIIGANGARCATMSAGGRQIEFHQRPAKWIRARAWTPTGPPLCWAANDAGAPNRAEPN